MGCEDPLFIKTGLLERNGHEFSDHDLRAVVLARMPIRLQGMTRP
jgi:hypothetical protein